MKKIITCNFDGPGKLPLFVAHWESLKRGVASRLGDLIEKKWAYMELPGQPGSG